MTQRIWTMDGPSMGYGVMSGGSSAWLYWVAVGLGLVVWRCAPIESRALVSTHAAR